MGIFVTHKHSSSAIPLAVDFVLGTETIYQYLKQLHVKESTLRCDLHRSGRTLNPYCTSHGNVKFNKFWHISQVCQRKIKHVEENK